MKLSTQNRLEMINLKSDLSIFRIEDSRKLVGAQLLSNFRPFLVRRRRRSRTDLCLRRSSERVRPTVRVTLHAGRHPRGPRRMEGSRKMDP